MIKYILFGLIIFYCIFVAVKMIKNLKKGKCMGCSGSDCSCGCKKKE